MEIEFKEFSLYRNENILLENVKFKVKKNFYHLTGQNGTGKTSLLNCLYKLNQNYKGDIFINNKNLKKINTNILREKYINYVNQNIILFEELTIKENVMFLKKNKKVQNFLLKEIRSELKVDLNLEVSKLSGGEKQYINILMNLIPFKPINIVDEPFNNLHINRIKKIERILEKINGTTILVSHKKSNYNKLKIYQKRLEEI